MMGLMKWINVILYYDLRNLLWNPNNKRDKILEWLNSRKPLSVRIKEYKK